jgi:hypothetical protein
MGFSYEGRKLCCDECSTAGARKYKCPAGYCQAVALCPRCKKSPIVKAKLKEIHKDCPAKHARYMAREAETARLLAEGKRLRCSALNTDDGKVHVLFKDKDGNCVGFYMSPSTYDAEPLGENRTPEDYMRMGELTPAPDSFYMGTTKQIVAQVNVPIPT